MNTVKLGTLALLTSLPCASSKGPDSVCLVSTTNKAPGCSNLDPPDSERIVEFEYDTCQKPETVAYMTSADVNDLAGLVPKRLKYYEKISVKDHSDPSYDGTYKVVGYWNK